MSKRFLSLGFLAAAVGCNGGAPATTPHAVLFSSAAQAADSNCPAGGTAISSGVDTDGNGTLDAGEVTNTYHICNGTNGTVGAGGASGTEGETGIPSGAHATLSGSHGSLSSPML